MRVLYKTATFGYVGLVKMFSLFNEKARKWVDGRSNFIEFTQNLKVIEPLIWFHCASLGEFEQGKPVMEAFKRDNPNWKLLITFFSPSGYEVRKNYELADYVIYLPIETNSNINRFIRAFDPQIAVFVKYEFWYDYMAALHSRNIPLIFISSTFRSNQIFFRPFGQWFLKQIKNVNMFFVQNEFSKQLLLEHNITKVEVSGDTRFDRVINSVKAEEEIENIREFKGNNKIVIFGSAWSKETELVQRVLKELPSGWKMIYAPHEIHRNKLDQFIEDIDLPAVKFTRIDKNSATLAKVLILDTIGHLARMYNYADVAVVGGGFTDGIHNILEPLAFGVPVFFGPKHKKFWEGQESIDEGVGFELNENTSISEKIIFWSENPKELDKIQKLSTEFVQERKGATEKISRYLNTLT